MNTFRYFSLFVNHMLPCYPANRGKFLPAVLLKNTTSLHLYLDTYKNCPQGLVFSVNPNRTRLIVKYYA